MSEEIHTVTEYLTAVPNERREVFMSLRNVILKNLPEGFEETLNYGMIGYVVPHSLYPAGYHCNPDLPLPFINIASQKNYIALYHMGLYADEVLNNWFVSEYPKHSKLKLDMGKSCIRFKKIDTIPLDLIGGLVSKMSVENWIALYQANIKKK
ncbi:DUF1801 domain-containing protein [Joostella sp. CR20]|uniref:DUF1801 domain-containing protein n=1 Tax=Joostella sp. CR20 TaxID=2804312 RepID=UPI00313CA86F